MATRIAERNMTDGSKKKKKNVKKISISIQDAFLDDLEPEKN